MHLTGGGGHGNKEVSSESGSEGGKKNKHGMSLLHGHGSAHGGHGGHGEEDHEAKHGASHGSGHGASHGSGHGASHGSGHGSGHGEESKPE